MATKWINKSSGIYLLIIGSLIFYAGWKFEYIWLLLASIIINFSLGNLILSNQRYSRQILIAGIFFNLIILGYYKYSGFFLDIIGFEGIESSITLPLAISFFTFQQIAYLVDAYKGQVSDNSFKNYVLFVSFFPQLVSGPIVHHKEILGQFSNQQSINYKTTAAAILILVIGLFKKTVIADGLEPHATWVYQISESGIILPAQVAWSGAIAFTLQIYFDFSGYSDIAIGSALLFGIQLPINFNSPLKAISIISFWRRWHITLSNFLRDYLYIPMGGNRKGQLKRYWYILITMLLGGMWHGSGWIYIFWGGAHGVAIIVNHIFSMYRPHTLLENRMYLLLSWLVTFIFIVFTFIIFKSHSVNGMMTLIHALFNFEALTHLKNGVFMLNSIVWTWFVLIILTLIVKFSPNTQTIVDYNPKNIYEESSVWRPSSALAVLIAAMTIISFYQIMTSGYAEFIYRFF